jgi:hypothetical protein
MDDESFGAFVRERRKALNLSQAELGRLVSDRFDPDLPVLPLAIAEVESNRNQQLADELEDAIFSSLACVADQRPELACARRDLFQGVPRMPPSMAGPSRAQQRTAVRA